MALLGAGQLTEVITIQREVRVADGGGGYDLSWSTVATLWAAATWLRGGEGERQGAMREIAVYRFSVLSAAADAAAITTADRLVWNGETYNIRERPRRQAHQPITDILAETGVTT